VQDQPNHDLKVLNRTSRRLTEFREKLGELDEVMDKMVGSNATEAIETDSTKDFLDRTVEAQDAI
jgi:hypothetical protein